jgi:hypothetical protein
MYQHKTIDLQEKNQKRSGIPYPETTAEHR